MVVLWLSLIVLLPLAAVLWKAADQPWSSFWNAISNPQAQAALRFTLLASAAAALVNAVMGTLTAWVLVRDEFRGKRYVNMLIDLPFALPTIVAGLTLLALYGPQGGTGINLAFTRIGVVTALLFVTLPFVVRAVQPVLIELDREMEEAAASLGARRGVILRRIVLPTMAPAILSGAALAFARAVGEFGSVVLLSGNIPYRTEVAAVHVFTLVQSDDPGGAAAVSVMLLALSLVVLAALHLTVRRRTRHAS